MRNPTLANLLTPVERLPTFLDYDVYQRNDKDCTAIKIYDPDAQCVWRVVGSGVRSFPVTAPNTKKVLDVLSTEGAEPIQRSSGSPANATAYIIGVRFLNGGLAGVTGDYWYGERGVWVWGSELVRFLAKKLELKINKHHELHLARR